MTGRAAALAQQLRERIAIGDVGAGGALESESVLGARHSVSRVTVRKALEELRAQGLVESRRGSGWFVTGGTFTQPLAVGTFAHAGSAVSAGGRAVVRRIVDFGFCPAPAAVARALSLAADSDVLRSRSVRLVDGIALDLVQEWVPAAAAARVSRRDAEVVGIWRTLQSQGYQVHRVRQTITAATAAPDEAPLLNTSPGDALLLIRRLALSDTDTPLALSDHRYLAHRFSLEVEFRGWTGGAAAEPPGLRALEHPTAEETTP